MSTNVRTMILTIIGTLSVLGLAIGSYVLGTRSSSTSGEQLVVTTQPPANLVPNVNTVVAVPTANIAIAVNMPTARPTPKPEQKRNKGQGAETGWTYITETHDSPDGYYYYYQPTSVTKSATSATAWLRQYPMRPVAFGKKNKMGSPVDYVLEKIVFDCDSDTYMSLDETYFDLDGSSIPQKRGYTTFHPVVPGTTLSTAKIFVCTDALLK